MQTLDENGKMTHNGGPLNETMVSEAVYEEDIFRERAIQIIENHDQKDPLFLMYSSHLIHTPLQIPRSYHETVTDLTENAGGAGYDLLSRKLYAAMVYYLDEAIGKFVTALKKRKMYKNTLIVFMSDNGKCVDQAEGCRCFRV